MFTRCAYYFKLYGIVAISILLLASVESAPDRPFLFTFALAVFTLAIRLLWRSVIKTEAAMKTKKADNKQRAAPKVGAAHEKKIAA